MENVVPFRHPVAPIQPIANYVRLGDTGHLKLAAHLATGRFPATRVVADASRIKHQKDLIAALRVRDVEIVLDTRAAELSALEKFSGFAKSAPWSILGEGKPLHAGHFDPRAGFDIFGQIARFALEHKVDSVLAPTHYLGDPTFNRWFAVDRESCRALRRALDKEGGARIAIDYPVILPNTMLNDGSARAEIVAGLDGLPYDNLWVRASGFGNDAGPLATRRYITSMLGFHNLGKPIVADYLGGVVGHAAIAFGAVSGHAHGNGERERFDARSWHKPVPPRNSEDKFGRAVRVFIAGLDRSATVPELEVMIAARGGRRLIACCDRMCCPHGFKDMVGDPRQHASYQNFKILNDLAAVPDLNREAHFLNGRMAEVDRQARAVKDLKLPEEEAELRDINVEKLSKRLSEHSRQVEKIRLSLEDLHEARGDGAPRARALTRQVVRTEQERAESK